MSDSPSDSPVDSAEVSAVVSDEEVGTRLRPAHDDFSVWSAPAKVNLFLHVVGRRPDGYHELQTLFQFLDFGECVRLRPRADSQILRLGAVRGVAPDDDLSVRAAEALCQATGCRRGVDIEITKRIPMGAGLGGGSSDAASTLVGLNQIWGLDLSEEQLKSLGVGLGADVPVFIHGHAAWAEGVGEQLQSAALSTPWYLVVNPGIHVPTAAVFGAFALTRNTPRLRIRDLFLGCGINDGAGGRVLSAPCVMERFRNDCEPVVRQAHREVDAALAWLAARGVARMTGTGASVFAPFEGYEQACAALEHLPEAWRGTVVRGMNRSPLLDERDSYSEAGG